ncbi:transcriptional regulator [Isoptericola sp. NEAU-Y5]|uniref:Transcriptional regulator n=1 Tax=Isoptericola luteus TaxID=2879484 RepID=A0ABS7ZGR9_9MICO|nr:transcriptional regulator [Isoptericola sp. NEAU-Y5]MCA5894225.1 transcriptional regulator [Isoptericola sp. NEAU-Y5]
MSRLSEPGLLVLHAVRVRGTADPDAVAARYGLDVEVVQELLLDLEALGQVRWAAFGGTGGWSLTERGRAEDERLLAAELAGDPDGRAAAVVGDVLHAFAPLNARLLRACTDWQLRPADAGRLDVNDHADAAWDAHVLDELAAVVHAAHPLLAALAAELRRFDGYDARLDDALAAARAGDGARVAGVGAASVHGVWMELHEDLLATAGITRSAPPDPRARRGPH